MISKPLEGEYAPYAKTYIDHVPDDGKVIEHLENNFADFSMFLEDLDEAKTFYRYAPGKWTIKEILLHLMDSERVFAYRALRIARNDKTPLPGFEQDDYIPFVRAKERNLDGILEEYAAVRDANILLFKSFDEEAWLRTGTVNNHTVSVRALAYIIAGHELYHWNVIKERYL